MHTPCPRSPVLSLSDGVNDRGQTCRRVPSIVLMHRLEVVRAEQEDDEIEGRLRFNNLRDAGEGITPRLVRVVEDR